MLFVQKRVILSLRHKLNIVNFLNTFFSRYKLIFDKTAEAKWKSHLDYENFRNAVFQFFPKSLSDCINRIIEDSHSLKTSTGRINRLQKSISILEGVKFETPVCTEAVQAEICKLQKEVESEKMTFPITTTSKDMDAVTKNSRAKELEKEGRVDEAILLYEENVTARFDGSHPYERLAIIYTKRKQYNDAIRVLHIAIDVFENDIPPERADRLPKLAKFQERLSKLENQCAIHERSCVS